MERNRRQPIFELLGLDASGEWRLTITDDTGGDSGILFGWELIFDFGL